MPDSRDNTTSQRIYQLTLNSIAREQLRLKENGGEKPSVADLVAKAWALYLNNPEAEPSLIADPEPQLPPVVAYVRDVLNGNYTDPRERLLAETIREFFEVAQKSKSQTKPRRLAAVKKQ